MILRTLLSSCLTRQSQLDRQVASNLATNFMSKLQQLCRLASLASFGMVMLNSSLLPAYADAFQEPQQPVTSQSANITKNVSNSQVYSYTTMQTQPSQTIMVELDSNHPLEIAQGKLNLIKLPFKEMTVDTVSDVELIARGNTLLVAPSNWQAITVIISNKNQPDQNITLTLLPQSIPSVSYNIVIPSLVQAQTLLNNPKVTLDDYMAQLSRLLRHVAEVVQQQQSISRGAVRAYAEKNFKFNSSQLNPKALNIIDITNDKLANPHYEPITCHPEQLQITKNQVFQPVNPYFAGIRIRYVEFTNTSNQVFEYEPSSCSQPNVMAASLLSFNKLVPAVTGKLILLEKISY